MWHSAANETFIMLASHHCGLPTAEVFYEPLTRSCVVKRFDRVADKTPSATPADAALHALHPQLPPGAATLAQRLHAFVRKTTQQTAKRLLDT